MADSSSRLGPLLPPPLPVVLRPVRVKTTLRGGGCETMGLDNGVRLTWVGHATWILETPGGKRVLIDPWVTGNPVVPEHLKDPGPADVFLLTHGHSDHIGDVAQLAERHSPQAVLCMVELGGYLEGLGVQNVVGFNKGGTVEVAGIRFTMVAASHSSSIGDESGGIIYLGEANGYVVA